MKIKTSQWKSFRVGDLFDIHPTSAYKLTNHELYDGGNNPVIANSAYNNGVGGYSSLKTTEKRNMITFSDTVDANTIFYQEKNFIGYPHVQGLYPKGKYKKEWTKYRLLFFVTVFRKVALAKGFDYGNKFRRDIAENLNIELPVLENGDPNWIFMDSFVKGEMKSAKNKVKAINFVNKIIPRRVDMSKWGKLQLKDLFEICKGSRLTKVAMKEGTINYVGASSFNNGITNHISNTQHLHPGGTLTTTYNGSDIGRTFYQKDKFWATDDVNVLYPKFEMNKYIALFLAPIIKAAGSKYIYKNKWKIEEMENAYIYLPFAGGEPDWKYMELFIKKIEKSVCLTIDNLIYL